MYLILFCLFRERRMYVWWRSLQGTNPPGVFFLCYDTILANQCRCLCNLGKEKSEMLLSEKSQNSLLKSSLILQQNPYIDFTLCRENFDKDGILKLVRNYPLCCLELSITVIIFFKQHCVPGCNP